MNKFPFFCCCLSSQPPIFVALRLLGLQGELKVNRRFLLFCLRHELSLGVGTLDPLYRAIIWSLNET